MTLADYIAALSAIRAEHGGQIEVCNNDNRPCGEPRMPMIAWRWRSLGGAVVFVREDFPGSGEKEKVVRV